MTTFAPLFVPDELREPRCPTGPGSRRCSTPSAALVNAEAIAGVVPRARPARDRRALPRRPLRHRRARARPAARPGTRSSRSCGRCASAVGAEAAGLRALGRDQPGHRRHAPRCSSRERALGLDRWPGSTGPPRRCAALARAHRATPMAGRTLLQQAVPTTFGLKAAGWLVGVREARARLADVRDERLRGAARRRRRHAGGARRARPRGGARSTPRELDLAEPLAALAHRPHRAIASSAPRSPRPPAACAKIAARRRPARPDRGRRGAPRAPAAAPRRCRTSATRPASARTLACAGQAPRHASRARRRRAARARARGRRLARRVGRAVRRARRRGRRRGGAARGARGARGRRRPDAREPRPHRRPGDGRAGRVRRGRADRPGSRPSALVAEAARGGDGGRDLPRRPWSNDGLGLAAEEIDTRARPGRRLEARRRPSSTARSDAEESG